MKGIKFRAWNGKTMTYFDLRNLTTSWEEAIWDEVSNATILDWNNNLLKAILMQDTGLKDKNGKEIYEDDVVRLKTNYHTNNKPFGWQNVVIFDNGIAFKAKNANGDIYNLEEEVEGDGWEVIGNIYENSNLLNQTL